MVFVRRATEKKPQLNWHVSICFPSLPNTLWVGVLTQKQPERGLQKVFEGFWKARVYLSIFFPIDPNNLTPAVTVSWKFSGKCPSPNLPDSEKNESSVGYFKYFLTAKTKDLVLRLFLGGKSLPIPAMCEISTYILLIFYGTCRWICFIYMDAMGLDWWRLQDDWISTRGMLTNKIWGWSFMLEAYKLRPPSLKLQQKNGQTWYPIKSLRFKAFLKIYKWHKKYIASICMASICIASQKSIYLAAWLNPVITILLRC